MKTMHPMPGSIDVAQQIRLISIGMPHYDKISIKKG